MTGNKTYKEKETEERLGKKKYIERKVQDQEADDEIQEYLDSEGRPVPRDWLNYGGTD
jgi:hypothetical protein